MNLNELIDISPAKRGALRARIARLRINLEAVEEAFVRGGWRGGQKINKTANCVVLSYPPLGIRVRCQRERRRSLNRFLALRELVDRIEMKVSPETSERLRERERIRRNKDRARRRGGRWNADAAPPSAPGGDSPHPGTTPPESRTLNSEPGARNSER